MSERKTRDNPPLGQEVFGPMWPSGTPEGWPEETADAYRLVFDIDVPPDMSDDEIVRRVAELASSLDAYHRALGHAGLELESAEVAVAAEVEAKTEVPT